MGKIFMKKLVKRMIGAGIIAGALCAASMVTNVAHNITKNNNVSDNSKIKIVVDGRSLKFSDVSPTIINGSTMVPMRAVFESLGAAVTWDGSTETATGTRGADIVSVTINDKFLCKNGDLVELNEPATIINDNTMVPVRAVSEAFGCEVTWDGDTKTVTVSTVGSIPQYGVSAYDGESAYVVVNDNEPYFRDEELTDKSFEYYSELDYLGRVGVCYASIGKDLMPTEGRESISMVKPSGWRVSKYDFVDGELLYNRCHLIGFQLTGENANEKNLITGTRYMNVDGMLPFENKVAEYVKRTGNHVMYRTTPVFEGENLVADGIVIEAESVEDDGDGVSFNVFCYNVQPGVVIDYSNGSNYEQGWESDDESVYILNTKNKKFHKPGCESSADIKAENRKEYNGSRSELIKQGYDPCGACKP